MPNQETPQPEQQSRETDSTNRELEEWEQALVELTDRIDTLLQEAPDTFRMRDTRGHKKDNTFIRSDIASLSGRQIEKGIDISRESYEDGNKEYVVTYRVPTEDLDYHPSGYQALTVIWRIDPDGTLREGGIPLSPETLQTIASQITEFENSELGLDPTPPEEVEWPSRMDRTRQFARRVLKAIR